MSKSNFVLKIKKNTQPIQNCEYTRSQKLATTPYKELNQFTKSIIDTKLSVTYNLTQPKKDFRSLAQTLTIIKKWSSTPKTLSVLKLLHLKTTNSDSTNYGQKNTSTFVHQ